MVWTEIPLVDEIPKNDPVFEKHALAMAEEMVEGNFNHPSIIVWGIFNEVYQFRRPDGSSEKLLARIRDRVHELDPSRPVGGASNGSKIGVNAVPDVLGMNLYPGWYGTSADMMDTFIEESCVDNKRSSLAISEYGAGGSVIHHDDPLARPRPASFWHPEEYQAYFHARAYRYMVDNPRVWGAFVWQMFDSASDSRQEGDRAGINDKGLVTRDRKIRKDAWYLYHANWSGEAVFHLAGSRWKETDRDEISVLGFSNIGDAELFVNGVHFSSKRADAS
jgi:beta-galactosidase